MAKLKLTKTLIDSTKAEAKDIELRDTIVPGFLCKVTPAGSKVFMVQYRTNAGLKRKPSIGRFGELSVEQARMIASDLMADVRRGKDPSAQKAADRTAPTVVELCARFITDYSMMRNKPASVASYQRQIDMKVIPHMGQVKIKDVTREHIVDFMKKNMHAPIQANRVMSCLSKMFNMAGTYQAPTLVDMCPRMRSEEKHDLLQMIRSSRFTSILIKQKQKSWSIHHCY